MPSAREDDFDGAGIDAALFEGALHPPERARTEAIIQRKMGRQVINDPSCRAMMY
jgi:hypothetical protein